MDSQVGAIQPVSEVAAFTAALRGPQGEAITVGAVGGMVSSDIPGQERDEIVQQMLLTDRETASILMFDHASQDWRDVVSQITVPTLVLGGESSMFSTTSIENLSAAIPGSEVRIISAADRGSHFSFLENPAVVNDAIRKFIEA